MPWVPTLFTSGLTGQRINRVLDEVLAVNAERQKRISTGQLNDLISRAMTTHPPASHKGRMLRLYYSTQIDVAHRGKIDHEPAVGDTDAEHAVAATAHADLQVALAAVADRLDHVIRARAAHDRPRPAVHHGVPHGPGLVVAGSAVHQEPAVGLRTHHRAGLSVRVRAGSTRAPPGHRYGSPYRTEVRPTTPPGLQDASRVGRLRPVPRRGRHPMLTMTNNAAEAVRRISDGSGLEPDPGLRISRTALPGGHDARDRDRGRAAPSDQTVEEGGARIYLEELVVPALDDKVLDAEIEGDQVRFALRDAQPGSADGNAPSV